MRHRIALVLGFLLSAQTLQAQNELPIAGKWQGEAKSPISGQNFQALLTVQGEKSTWRYYVQASFRQATNPCLGRDLPAQVNQETDGKYTVKINGSQAITGCPEVTLSLNRLDDKTLEGSFNDGRAVKLVKQ